MGLRQSFSNEYQTMMRRIYLWAGSLVVGCAIGYLVYQWLIGPQIHLEPVGTGTLVHTIVASGRVQSEHRINLGAQITGTVSKVLADEGQKVVRGQRPRRIAARHHRAQQRGCAEVRLGRARHAHGRRRHPRLIHLQDGRGRIRQRGTAGSIAPRTGAGGGTGGCLVRHKHCARCK